MLMFYHDQLMYMPKSIILPVAFCSYET